MLISSQTNVKTSTKMKAATNQTHKEITDIQLLHIIVNILRHQLIQETILPQCNLN